MQALRVNLLKLPLGPEAEREYSRPGLRRYHVQVSRMPQRLHSYSSHPENKKYFPSAVQFPADCRRGCAFGITTGCNPLPFADISQIDCPTTCPANCPANCSSESPVSTVKRIVAPSQDQAGDLARPLTCASSCNRVPSRCTE